CQAELKTPRSAAGTPVDHPPTSSTLSHIPVASRAETVSASPAIGFADDQSTLSPVAPPGYNIIERIGGGGMGAVYLARELAADRLVAMKFLRAGSGSAAAARFLVEVRALAGLDHPHIVRVLSTDFTRPDPFFTMEYVPGGTLRDRIDRAGPAD